MCLCAPPNSCFLSIYSFYRLPWKDWLPWEFAYYLTLFSCYSLLYLTTSRLFLFIPLTGSLSCQGHFLGPFFVAVIEYYTRGQFIKDWNLFNSQFWNLKSPSGCFWEGPLMVGTCRVQWWLGYNRSKQNKGTNLALFLDLQSPNCTRRVPPLWHRLFLINS